MDDSPSSLIRDLQDPDWRVALRAEDALVAAGPAGATALAVLLREAAGEPVLPAFRVLARVGSASLQVPVLRKRLGAWSFPSPDEQEACQAALAEIRAATGRCGTSRCPRWALPWTITIFPPPRPAVRPTAAYR